MTHDVDSLWAGPATGIRVLELGSYIAAPFAARLLADFGAEVIKVERPATGDELRRWRLFDGDTSMLFRTMNRNKRCMTADLSTEPGQAIARSLVAGADVVIENFRPGTLERWGLGPDALLAAHPGLVLVRISGYGQTGPYRDRPGFGGVAEAVGGLRNLTGYADRPPTRVGVSLADSVAGLYAVIGALLALRARDADGQGDVVDVALYESVYSPTESMICDYDAFGVAPVRSGAALPGVVPSGTYPCRDGRWVVISGNGDAIFRRLMTVAGRPDLATDQALADNAGRIARAAELDAVIGSWSRSLRLDEALSALEAAGVPAGPINSPADIVADPHFAARGMLQRHPVQIRPGRSREVLFPGVVPRMERRPGRVRWLGPDLGADTAAILQGAG
jgi:crotonobetainyl-CoA:carnitine CoA-transferase CaiB-like acyl-CoA transferase